MERKLRRMVFACLMMCALVLPAAADEISIRTSIWEPYLGEPDAQHPGYMIEIVKAIFGKAGHTVDYQLIPRTRAIEETRKGSFTAIIGALKGDAPDFVFPRANIGLQRTAFFVKAGSKWKYTGISSLASVSLAVIADYAYGGEEDGLDAYIAANSQNRNLIQVAFGDNALETNIRKLLAGRAGAVVEDMTVMLAYLKSTGRAGQAVPAGQLESSEMYIAFSPANPKAKEYADLYDKGIAALRASGELARILAAYGLTDWE